MHSDALTHTQPRMHNYTHPYTHAHTHMRTCTHTHTYSHMHTHKLTRTHTHTHKLTLTPNSHPHDSCDVLPSGVEEKGRTSMYSLTRASSISSQTLHTGWFRLLLLFPFVVNVGTLLYLLYNIWHSQLTARYKKNHPPIYLSIPVNTGSHLFWGVVSVQVNFSEKNF